MRRLQSMAKKFEEIKNYVHKFIMDDDHVMDRIKENLFGISTTNFDDVHQQ